MIKIVNSIQKIAISLSTEEETSSNNDLNSRQINESESMSEEKGTLESNLKQNFLRKIVSLNSKEQVESVNSSEINHSDDMDIDEQNDIVNDLSFIKNIQKSDEDQDDQMPTSLSVMDRILYANTKKHQGNEHFKENNLEQAIEAYKFGLSLLKPESFSLASPKDCLLMAELTSNILYNMGTCYFILMSYRHAVKFYDQAILIKPNYSKAIHNRALCHLEEGNLLQAYNDIKLAYHFDKHNSSIQTDLKKIEQQYFGAYPHHNLVKSNSGLDLPDTKIMSKSMIENNSKQFQLQEPDETTSSMIKKEQKLRSNLEITKLSEENFDFVENKIQKNSTLNSKQRVKSFYGKKFYRNQIPRTPKTTKNSSYVIDEPNYRPFRLNKRLKGGNQSPESWVGIKPQKDKFSKSAGEFLKRQKRFVLLQEKSSQFSKNEEKNKQPKRKQSKQKRVKQNRDNYWGFIPIFMATGYGLYHGLKAVLGR